MTAELPLPKFVIADDGADRDFIVHLHKPHFIVEMNVGPPSICFLDPPIFDPNHGTPHEQTVALLTAALEFVEQVEHIPKPPESF